MSHTFINLFNFNLPTINFNTNVQQSLFKDLFRHFNLEFHLVQSSNLQGFKHFLYTPLEAGEVMASCEARLLKQKIISGPFTAKEIAEGALLDHLTQEDYDAPLKVNIILL